MRRMTFATVLLVVAALAVPAGAQMDPQDQQKQEEQKQEMPKSGSQEQDMQQRSGRRMAPQRQQVTGEIAEVRTIKVKQTKQDHLLAKVKLDTGQTAVLDLGPADKARQSGLKLEKRQQLQAEGTVGQLNNRPVLVVTRAQQDGKTVMLNAGKQPEGTHGYQEPGTEQEKGKQDSQQKDMQKDREQESQQGAYGYQPAAQQEDGPKKSPEGTQGSQSGSGQQDMQRMTQVQGQIMDVSTVKSEQDQSEHLVAEIRLQQTGQTVKVDLGPADEARDSGLKLSQGQQIQVTGRVGRLNGTPVVVVQRAQQDGKSVQLNAGAKQEEDAQKQQDDSKQDMQSR